MIIKKSELSTQKIFYWFRENHVKPNADKWHLLVNANMNAKVEGLNIKNSTEEKLLGKKFEFKLLFENHFSYLCTKTSPKVLGLT